MKSIRKLKLLAGLTLMMATLLATLVASPADAATYRSFQVDDSGCTIKVYTPGVYIVNNQTKVSSRVVVTCPYVRDSIEVEAQVDRKNWSGLSWITKATSFDHKTNAKSITVTAVRNCEPGSHTFRTEARNIEIEDGSREWGAWESYSGPERKVVC